MKVWDEFKPFSYYIKTFSQEKLYNEAIKKRDSIYDFDLSDLIYA